MKKKFIVVMAMLVVVLVGCSKLEIKFVSLQTSFQNVESEADVIEFKYEVVLSGAENVIKDLKVVDIKLNETYQSLILQQLDPIVQENSDTDYLITGSILLNTKEMSVNDKKAMGSLLQSVIVKTAKNQEIEINIE